MFFGQMLLCLGDGGPQVGGQTPEPGLRRSTCLGRLNVGQLLHGLGQLLLLARQPCQQGHGARIVGFELIGRVRTVGDHTFQRIQPYFGLFLFKVAIDRLLGTRQTLQHGRDLRFAKQGHL